jgi:hypothetical protein
MHLSGREVASQFGKCASCRSAAASMRAAGTPASRSRIDPCRCRYVCKAALHVKPPAVVDSTPPTFPGRRPAAPGGAASMKPMGANVLVT